MSNFGKPLIILGLVLVVTGLFFTFAPKLPAWLGRLPGNWRKRTNSNSKRKNGFTKWSYGHCHHWLFNRI